MSKRKKVVALVLAVLAVLGLTALAGLATSSAASASRGPSMVAVASSVKPAVAPAVEQAAARRYSCPASDGSATWGDAKMCTDAEGARFHFRDKLTDGYCVRVRYWSADNGAWLQTGPTACVTGQWVTFTDCCAKLCTPTARLYRDNGSYFTIPSNYC